ncbi:MAG TPA: AraC family transcriptional regulator [Micromonosporaceae bacterium]|nr:AraC family transcriptional regulator [Micromonosporaceae bacterium]
MGTASARTVSGPTVSAGTVSAGTASTGTVSAGLLAHLRRARDHMDRHYRDELDLEQIARVAGVSKYHFSRCFEATYGETPMRYLTRRRIERAQDLLRNANVTVTEVCMLVGYASLGSFSTKFAQLVGEPPTEYRNRWASRGRSRVPGCYIFMRGVWDHGGMSGAPQPNEQQSTNLEEARGARQRLR